MIGLMKKNKGKLEGEFGIECGIATIRCSNNKTEI